MEMNQNKGAEGTPNMNNWWSKYSYTNQVMKTSLDRSTCNMFETPSACSSHDSGFQSSTPNSAESFQNLKPTTQHFSMHSKTTPDSLIGINFHSFIPVNSTPNSCLEMMDTSLYPENEQTKDNFYTTDTDEFNFNNVEENNILIYKEEKSTNINSLYNDIHTDKNDATFGSEASNEDSKRPTLFSGSPYCTHDVLDEASKSKLSLDSKRPTLDTTPFGFKLLETLYETPSPMCMEKKSVAWNQSIEKKNMDLEKLLQSINCLPSLKTSTKISRTSPNECLTRKKFLNGIECVDILYLLGVKQNFQHIVVNIFSYLTPYDLMNVKNVSATWNQIFSNIIPSQTKWKTFKKQYKEQKENHLRPKSQEPSSDFNLLRKRGRQTYLSTIENTQQSGIQSQKLSPQLSPPVSPSKRRFHLFQKEAQKLKHGERLLRCPKCTFPSHDPGSTYATCVRVGCKYEFCVFCYGAYFPNHQCPPLYTPRPCKRNSTIGSKLSKRNLRRL